MRQFFGLLLAFLLCNVILAAEKPFSVPIPNEDAILKTIKKEHPRLFGSPADFERIKLDVAKYPAAKEYHRLLMKEADKLVADPKPLEYVIPDGKRLLQTSRDCMKRVYTLAMAYRLTGEKKYMDRALLDLRAVCNFKDWNPSHFLDTAEMTHAVAIGYDWLYNDLSDDDKSLLKNSIRDKGLLAAKPVYDKNSWWAAANHNWNQVCNAGMAIGALAIAEDEPKLAAWIVNKAANSIQIAMREFAPDGAYVEGPGYWNYGVSYNVHLLSALDAALGTDFTLASFPGFDQTGLFRMHLVTPINKVFAYADTGDKAGAAPPMFWLAKKFNRPEYSWHERDVVKSYSPWHLLYFDPRGEKPVDLPTAAHFEAAGVVMMRSSWTSPDAVYIGFKGGSNAVNHSHLELGGIQLDAKGERFFIDLGTDDYNLPGYFSAAQRWKYLRNNNLGHNTLVIDGQIQDPKANAPVLMFKNEKSSCAAEALIDLTAAYAKQLESAKRRVVLNSDSTVFIQDELKGVDGKEIVWQVLTRADIKLNGNKATMTQKGKNFNLEIASPKGAVFEVGDAKVDPPQKQNDGVLRLFIRITGSKEPLFIDVRCE